MKRHLVIAGAGHAHMVTLANLHRFVEQGHRVTVIGPSAHHYYSGMGPGMLGKTYRPEDVRFEIRQTVERRGAVFLEGRVDAIDPRRRLVRLAAGESIHYDVLSCNLGSEVPWEVTAGDPPDVYPVKPIEGLLAAQRRILELGTRRRVSVGIVGGGPSAVEIAGNVWRLTRGAGMHPADIRILTGAGLLPRHPAGVRQKALVSLKKRGIEILENCRVEKIQNGRATDTAGHVQERDLFFVAAGVRPSPVFRNSGIATGPDGGLRVNRCLQSTQYPDIFGGGDCIHFEPAPLDKVGVYAVRQNPVLYHNLQAALKGAALRPFNPGGNYLLIFNLGDGTGILYKRPILLGGRIAFRIKDSIDRRFMRRFQQMDG